MEPITFTTEHEDTIHDAQMDYYGKKLATCSSDKIIKIFKITDNEQIHVADLKGHEGPVWAVSWCHPRFGVMLASCSHDRRVIIWKEIDSENNIWQKEYEYLEHKSSVNSISWSPQEYGLNLACGSSDSMVSILTFSGEQWTHKKFKAHQIGCNSVSWAPFNPTGSLITSGEDNTTPTLRLVTGGCDHLVKIWVYLQKEKEWKFECNLEGHENWVRSVSWAPNIGLPFQTIASCSQDKKVIIWSSRSDGKWEKNILPTFDDIVWSVSWSFTGNVLAVSSGENSVTLWREKNDGNWYCFSDLSNQN
ncbi:protein sec13 [Anaeramoeba ignava]|uniref:Protein sec13 n=1 Tax=Anaeramoeba ignava TaxID=1746090 RepID=A0A9Q0LPT3_ANAIG|nr:protein sec13 [Anaeramoeba ignava]